MHTHTIILICLNSFIIIFHLGDVIIYILFIISVCQLLGGPVYGRIGDIFGERTALIIALSSSMTTYIVTGKKVMGNSVTSNK